METSILSKSAFSVVGREGSTEMGEGFVQALWQEANARFAEVAPLARRDGDGKLAGIWGVMSDMGRRFRPWEENFTRGLYLAGLEVRDDAEPPEGWAKWTMPASEYLAVKAEPGVSFGDGVRHLREKGLPLVGAAYDYTDPAAGQLYWLFPIRRL